MIFNQKKRVGIVSYGTRIPQFKILGSQIAQAQGKAEQKLYKALGVESKTVPGIDEDTITLSTAAGFQALERLEITGVTDVREQVAVLFIGSESHPYAVKPSGTVVAQALGIASDSFQVDQNNQRKCKPLALADLQFACKAGTQALQIAGMYIQAGFGEYALAIGVDTAQARPGDILEYTAGAGGAAFILGSESKDQKKLLAQIVATTSVATDTPDFWRRQQQEYPEHAGRFTADPGYFAHIELATKQILKETGLESKDFEYCVFHTPNVVFPVSIAQKLGFSVQQIEPSLLVKQIGNTYAGASMLGLASTLDIAKVNKKILVVSYGSGSGSDAFILQTTQHLETARKQWLSGSTTISETVTDMIAKLTEISYEEYRKNSTH